MTSNVVKGTREDFSLFDNWIPQEVVGRYLGCSKRTVQRLVAAGKLQAWRFNDNLTLISTNSVLDHYETRNS